MSEEIHRFTLTSVWTGNGDGDGVLALSSWNEIIPYGVPAQLGGQPNRSNPEEMLLSAVCACYSITLALLIEKKRLPPYRLSLSAEGDVERLPNRTLNFACIRLAPTLHGVENDEAKHKTLTLLAHKAEQLCLVSRALRGNVEISVSPQFSIE